MDVMSITSASDQNHQTWQDASEVFADGRMTTYNYYSLLLAARDFHREASEQMFFVDVPDGLFDAADYLVNALENRGDAMDHLAKYVNTGDLEELRKAQQDLEEAEAGMWLALAEIIGVSEEAGLNSDWLLSSVECDVEARTCGLATP